MKPILCQVLFLIMWLDWVFVNVISVVEFQTGLISNMVGPKKQDFWPNINILDGNLGILWIRWMTVHWKLDMILENKVVCTYVQNWSYRKMVLTKKVLLNYWSWLTKKIRNIQMKIRNIQTILDKNFFLQTTY